MHAGVGVVVGVVGRGEDLGIRAGICAGESTGVFAVEIVGVSVVASFARVES